MPDSQDEEQEPTLDTALVRELLRGTDAFEKNNTEISDAAVDLSAEYLRLFSLEAYHRASELAAKEHSPIIEVQHLKRIIPGLLLDFR